MLLRKIFKQAGQKVVGIIIGNADADFAAQITPRQFQHHFIIEVQDAAGIAGHHLSGLGQLAIAAVFVKKLNINQFLQAFHLQADCGLRASQPFARTRIAAQIHNGDEGAEQIRRNISHGSFLSQSANRQHEITRVSAGQVRFARRPPQGKVLH